MNILEITLTTGDTYKSNVQAICNLYRVQTEPFIIIHSYCYAGHTPLAKRLIESLKAWHVLNASTWHKVFISVDKNHKDTRILSKWIKVFLAGDYEHHYVDSLEDARALAESIIQEYHQVR